MLRTTALAAATALSASALASGCKADCEIKRTCGPYQADVSTSSSSGDGGTGGMGGAGAGAAGTGGAGGEGGNVTLPIGWLGAGLFHTCVRANGEVWCWGLSQSVGTTVQEMTSPTPVQVDSLSQSSYVAVGPGAGHSCVIEGGSLRCWGQNFFGQIGDGTTTTAISQVDLGMSGAQVSVGTWHTCSVLGNGSAWCWGNNSQGQLGDGTTISSLQPTQVVFAGDVTAIASGSHHTCLITNGDIWCWGFNSSGQLGDGTSVNSPLPIKTFDSAFTSQLSVGEQHTCALEPNGTLRCWGRNDFGQVGDGTQVNAHVPKVVGTSIAAVAAGTNHTCAITTGFDIICWGSNAEGQLGDGNVGGFELQPVTVSLAGAAAAIAAGAGHTCALLNNGTVWCWGDGEFGQLGQGTATDSATPAQVLLP